MVPEMWGARGSIHPGDGRPLRLGGGKRGETLGEKSQDGAVGREREASGRGERDGEEGGMRRYREPRGAAPLAGSHPAAGGVRAPLHSAPGGRPTRTPWELFGFGRWLGRGGRGKQIQGGWGEHKGVCPRPWVARPGSGGGKGTLSELREAVGSDAEEGGGMGGSTPCPAGAGGGEGLAPSVWWGRERAEACARWIRRSGHLGVQCFGARAPRFRAVIPSLLCAAVRAGGGLDRSILLS